VEEIINRKGKKMKTFIAACMGGAVIIGIIVLLVTFPFMWIWNYAVVEAINVAQPINFYQSFYLMLFCAFFIRSSSSSS